MGITSEVQLCNILLIGRTLGRLRSDAAPAEIKYQVHLFLQLLNHLLFPLPSYSFFHHNVFNRLVKKKSVQDKCSLPEKRPKI